MARRGAQGRCTRSRPQPNVFRLEFGSVRTLADGQAGRGLENDAQQRPKAQRHTERGWRG